MLAKTAALQNLQLIQNQLDTFIQSRDYNLAEYFRLQREHPLNIEGIRNRQDLYQHTLYVIRILTQRKQHIQKQIENLAC